MASLFRSSSPTKSAPTSRIIGRHPRQSSAVYTSFSTKQIQGFKEAFNFIDSDQDGLITKPDLKTLLENLGKGGRENDRTLDRYFEEGRTTAADGRQGINFTQFLTMFGEHLSEMDDSPTLLDAFSCFDENDDGTIPVEEMRSWLSEVGDRMTDAEIDRLLKGPFTDKRGQRFDYKAFVEAVKMSEPAELE